MEVVSVARRLPELPKVEEAVEQGAISFQAAAVITESADKIGAELLAQHQDELVQRAESTDPSSLRQEVRRVEHKIDSERMLREAEWAHKSRWLQLQTMRDGRVRLEGLLDAEGGAVLRTAIGAALGPRSAGDTRSEGQRRR
jgi:DNA-binding FrmR family transcriptional regulator